MLSYSATIVSEKCNLWTNHNKNIFFLFGLLLLEFNLLHCTMGIKYTFLKIQIKFKVKGKVQLG